MPLVLRITFLLLLAMLVNSLGRRVGNMSRHGIRIAQTTREIASWQIVLGDPGCFSRPRRHRQSRRFRTGVVAVAAIAAAAVVVAHQNEGVLVFLPVLSALFAAVGDHFVPVPLAVGLGSYLELALVPKVQGSPSLSDALAEFLEVVLLLLGQLCGCDGFL